MKDCNCNCRYLFDCNYDCRYLFNKLNGEVFCAYWDNKDYISKKNTPDAYCLIPGIGIGDNKSVMKLNDGKEDKYTICTKDDDGFSATIKGKKLTALSKKSLKIKIEKFLKDNKILEDKIEKRKKKEKEFKEAKNDRNSNTQ